MNESKGLGDSIEKIARRIRVKQLIDNIGKKTGKDCGCKGRREKLNKMFPYKTPKNEDV